MMEVIARCTKFKIWALLVLLSFLLFEADQPYPALAGGCALDAAHTLSAVHVRQGRTLMQAAVAPSSPNVSTSYLVLAQHHTERRDPLNSFKIYRGGWDVKNEHYWASAGLTGGPGYVLAAAWLLFGLALLFLLCCCCCCCRARLKGAHQGGNALPLILLLLFTSATIAGSVLVYWGQGKLHEELSQTLHFVVGQSEEVVIRLRNTSAVLTESQSLAALQFALSSQRKAQIQTLNVQLATAATKLQNTTQENADNIASVLNRVRLAMILVAGVMLLLALLGFLFSTLGMTPLMYLLILLVWLLVSGTWLLCGVYIMLNNVVGDTCIAMKEWVANPSAQTSLQDILPCLDISTTDRVLNETRQLTSDAVNGINTGITAILNNGSSSRGLPLMCNPLQQTPSTPGCVNITNATEVWQPYVCNNTAAAQACQLGGKLTPQIYNQLNSSVEVVNGLNDNIPFLLDLANCKFVRQAFTEIRQQHCRHLREYLKWQYIGLALISGGFMFAIWVWIVFNRRRRHRFFHHSDQQPEQQFISKGDTPPKE